MLRRTKTTMINGKPILELPDRIVKIVECEFDRVQRQFYDSVQEKVQTSLEKLRAAINYLAVNGRRCTYCATSSTNRKWIDLLQLTLCCNILLMRSG